MDIHWLLLVFVFIAADSQTTGPVPVKMQGTTIPNFRTLPPSIPTAFAIIIQRNATLSTFAPPTEPPLPNSTRAEMFSFEPFRTSSASSSPSSTPSEPPSTVSSTETYLVSTEPPLPNVSPILQEVLANRTANSIEWVVTAPEATLTAIKDLTSQQNTTGKPIPFENVIICTEIIDSIVHTDTAVIANLESAQAVSVVDTTLAILDLLLQWGWVEGIMDAPASLQEARKVEQRLYEDIELIADVLPVQMEPHEFQKELIAMNVLRRNPGPDDEFEDMLPLAALRKSSNAARSLVNAVVVSDFKPRNYLNATFAFFAENGSCPDNIAELRITLSTLKKNFQAAKSSNRTFSVMLSAFERFRFGTFEHDSFFPGSKSRKVSPVMLTGKLNQPTQEETAVVSFATKVDALIQTPEGKRFRGSRNFQCVYFDYNLTAESGGWSDKGCRVKRQHTSWEDGTTVECECDHLTPFTMFFYLCSTLVDLEASTQPSVAEQFADLEPKVVATFSLSVSIVCLLIVFLHTGWKLWKKYVRLTPLNFTRLNVVISIFTTNITILVAEYIPESENRDACLVTAVMSHWFIMSSFFWMMAETFFLVKIIRGAMDVNYSISDTFDGIRWRVSLLAWGVPALFPLISGLSHIGSITDKFRGEAYGSQTLWCWIDSQHDGFFLGAFVVPVCVVAVTNIAIFAYYLFKRRQAQIEAGQRKSIRQGTISVLGTCFLLGATWLSGYFMLMFCCDDTAKKVAGVFFILLNGAQGVFVLWVYVSRLDGGFRYVLKDFKGVIQRLNRQNSTKEGKRKPSLPKTEATESSHSISDSTKTNAAFSSPQSTKVMRPLEQSASQATVQTISSNGSSTPAQSRKARFCGSTRNSYTVTSKKNFASAAVHWAQKFSSGGTTRRNQNPTVATFAESETSTSEV